MAGTRVTLDTVVAAFRDGATPEENPADLLEALASQLPESQLAAANEIRELAAQKSVPRIEERLMEIERELIHRILDSLPPSESAAIRNEIARAVGDVSKLDEKTRTRTEEANLRRIVRATFALPRLTLFR